MLLWDSKIEWGEHSQSIQQGDEPIYHFFEGYSCLPVDEAHFANVPVRVSLETQQVQSLDSDDENVPHRLMGLTISTQADGYWGEPAVGSVDGLLQQIECPEYARFWK